MKSVLLDCDFLFGVGDLHERVNELFFKQSSVMPQSHPKSVIDVLTTLVKPKTSLVKPWYDDDNQMVW